MKLSYEALLSRNNIDQTFVVGKEGLAKSEDNSPNSIWAAIVGAGGVLFGSQEEINRISTLLSDDRSSRTVSYLCNLTNSC